MALRYSGVNLGTMTIKQNHDGKDIKFLIQIRQCNALAAFLHIKKITEGEDKGLYKHTLYSFLADEQHAKNIIKNEGHLFFDEVSNIKLNLYYKESNTLLKIFVKAGYKVTCYYKEPKKK